MMRFTLLIFLLAFSLESSAKDFRGANFGDSCSQILEYELNQGSKLIEKNYNDMYIFENVYIDRSATIIYECKNGSFFAGNYQYTLPTLRAANDFFTVAVSQLESYYGQPASKAYETGYGSSAMWVDNKTNILLTVMNADNVRATVGILFKKK